MLPPRIVEIMLFSKMSLILWNNLAQTRNIQTGSTSSVKPYTERQQNTLPTGRQLLRPSGRRTLLIGLGSTPMSCWNHSYLAGWARGTVSRLWIISCSIQEVDSEGTIISMYLLMSQSHQQRQFVHLSVGLSFLENRHPRKPMPQM